MVTLVVVAVMLTLLQEGASDLITLDTACGVLLQDTCPELQKFVVAGAPSCAEKAPWNVILERRGGRRRRDVDDEDDYEEDIVKREKRAANGLTVLCGGTLVSSRHVVTAAHCLWANKGRVRTCREPFLSMTPEECTRNRCPPECLRIGPQDINVYLGVTDRTSKPRPRPAKVRAMFLHSQWDKNTPLNNITSGHDLAVLELVKPVTFGPTVWPICLPASSDRPLQTEGTQVKAFGFGVREITDTERIYAEIINKATLDISNQKECSSAWKTSGDQLCAKGDIQGITNGRVPDTCSGDSGGGLIAERFDGNFVLLGVVSFGESDCGLRGGRPGVYTNVLSHASWIRNVIGSGSNTQCRTEDGRVCQFPFSYEGKRYTRCTTENDPDGRLWCSTKVDKNGNHVQNEGQWGYCSDQCKLQRVEDLQIESRGSWSSWADWSPCSKSCGGGKKVRVRTCSKGNSCPGQDIQTKTCNSDTCKEEDSWTKWGSWSPCSATCGKGSRTRRRSCSSPTIANSVILRGVPRRGVTCVGDNSEVSECRSPKLCNSGRRKKWSSWSSFSSCSSTCVGGVRQRTRTCEGDRGKCFGTPTDTELCGVSECRMEKPVGDGSVSTVLVGGWVGNWLSNVTIVNGRGKSCPAPSLPIWLADHFSVFDGSRIMTCGGRSGNENTLCWYWDLSSSAWTRAPEMNDGRSYADAVEKTGQVWVTGGWDGKERHSTSEIIAGSSWKHGADLTGKRYQHCGVVLRDGSVVVTGGQEGETGKGDALSLVERYQWNGPFLQELPSMNQARWTHACTVVTLGGREAIIVAGGRVTSGPGDELSTVEMMVIGQPFWKYKKSLPQPRLAPSMVVIAGRPQLSGGHYEIGRREEMFPGQVLEYSLQEDEWRVVARIKGRSHHVALAVPSRLLPSC